MWTFDINTHTPETILKEALRLHKERTNSDATDVYVHKSLFQDFYGLVDGIELHGVDWLLGNHIWVRMEGKSASVGVMFNFDKLIREGV